MIENLKKDFWFYLISFVFTVSSLFILIKGETDNKRLLIGISSLLLFGGGSIIYYFLKNPKTRQINFQLNYIEESKTKIFLYFLGSLIFTVIGYILIIYTKNYYAYKMNPKIAIGLGFICILFFGTLFLISIYKLFSKSVKIIEVKEKGFLLKINVFKKPIFIEFEEILKIEMANIISNELVIISVKHPEKYIEKSWLNFFSWNPQQAGSTININPIITDYTSDEICNFLSYHLKKNSNKFSQDIKD